MLHLCLSVCVYVCVFSLGGGVQEGGVSRDKEIRGSDQQCKQEVSINCAHEMLMKMLYHMFTQAT